MKINVSRINEFTFYPDIEDNLTLPENDRFAIILKKVNQALTSTEYSKPDGKGGSIFNMEAKLRLHVVKFINAPTLGVKESGEDLELTIDILLSSEFPELYDVLSQTIIEIGRIEERGSIDTKK